MENPEETQLFNDKQNALLIKIMREKGIVGEWEEPLNQNLTAVKKSSSHYFTDLIGYEVLLIDNSTKTDRILYDPDRYSTEQALDYGDSPDS